jgi:hypothetical protein
LNGHLKTAFRIKIGELGDEPRTAGQETTHVAILTHFKVTLHL